MHLFPNLIALVGCLLLAQAQPQAKSQAKTQARQLGKARIVNLSAAAVLDENSAPVVTADGEVGFVSSGANGSLIAFNIHTSKIISSTSFGEVAGLVSLAETDSRKIIALPTTTFSSQSGSAAVQLLNASSPDKITKLFSVELPSGSQINPATAAPMTSDGRLGVIATGPNEPKLFSFSAETGKVVSEVKLPGWPNQVAISPLLHDGKGGSDYCVAVISTGANTLSLIRLDLAGRLIVKTSFAPGDMHFEVTNNPAFSPDGRTLYFGIAKGEHVFSVSVEDGSVLGMIKVASTPHRVTVVKSRTGSDLIGVTRINPAAKAPSALSILESQKGELSVKSEVLMPEGIKVSSANGVAFDLEKSLAWIGTLNGILMGFNLTTGTLDSYQAVGGGLRGFAASKGALVGVRSSTTLDEIAVVPLDKNSKEASASSGPAIKRINGDGEYLRLVIDGSNFGKDVAVELLKGGKVLSKRTPLMISDKQVVVLIPVGEIEAMGKFDVRVTDSLSNSSNAIAADARELLTPGRPGLNRTELARSDAGRKEATEAPGVKPGEQDPRHPSGSTPAVETTRQRRASPPPADSKLADTRTADKRAREPERVEPKPVSTAPGVMSEGSLQVSGRSQFVRPEIVDGSLRFVVHVKGSAKFKDFTLENPSRIVLDIEDAKNNIRSETLALGAGPVERVRVGQPKRGVLRVVLDVREPTRYAVTRDPDSVILTIGPVENATLNPR
jgi:hypothetical protein